METNKKHCYCLLLTQAQMMNNNLFGVKIHKM